MTNSSLPLRGNSAELIASGTWILDHEPHRGEEATTLVRIDDGKELTVVVAAPSRDTGVGPFTLLRVTPATPFATLGLLASITTCIARLPAPVLVISTFSYDYILIRDEHVERALRSLGALGLAVTDGLS